jgi:cell division protein FtsZ
MDLDFDMAKDSPNIIRVIGVGGGGSNAVNHMFVQGDIQDVSFVLCNTDSQALQQSNIPVKVQLGDEGLGAGAKPEVARKAAEESSERIKKMLSDGTKMVFITAGMGGGTGTGAAPVVARIAKEMGILTVGIVTIPFLFEGEPKILKALDGVDEIAKNVDALLVINNERLRSIYTDLTLLNAFAKADDTLLIAVKGIAEIITLPKMINLDFADVRSTLQDGGVAIMATGEATGENRITEAIQKALLSPLLSNKDISNSKRILLCVTFSPNAELIVEELDEIHDFMKGIEKDVEVIWGGGPDQNLKDGVKITILATGFGVKDVADRKDILGVEAAEALDEAAQEERRKRLERYYGKDAQLMNHNRRRETFLFDNASLDNDEVISRVDSSPTFERTRQELRKIKSLADTGTSIAEAKEKADNQSNQVKDGVINFE